MILSSKASQLTETLKDPHFDQQACIADLDRNLRIPKPKNANVKECQRQRLTRQRLTHQRLSTNRMWQSLAYQCMLPDTLLTFRKFKF